MARAARSSGALLCSASPSPHVQRRDNGANDSTGPPEDARHKTSRHTRLTALIVATALFMQNLDSTIIATALPTMARAFGADPVRMNVALTSYLLSLAVFIPASGWMADRYGTRNVFRAAIVVFTVGSVLCGRSDSLASWSPPASCRAWAAR